jgi:hypothetical protein
MAEAIYYLDDHDDEVLPCEASLEGWAGWLAKPDPSWPHDIASPGQHFEASRLFVLGDVKASRDFLGAWAADGTIPKGTTAFYVRHHQGSTGWDAEFSGETIEDALQDYDADDEDPAVWLACVADGGQRRVRFDIDASGRPTLTDVTDTLVVQ